MLYFLTLGGNKHEKNTGKIFPKLPDPIGCILPQAAPTSGFLFIRSTSLMMASGWKSTSPSRASR